MELVEGETLAARLKKGKLSINDTLLYGGQIAAALAEAHSKGITHRDLKPGNVMVGKNGVKVLDFGLAKSPGDGALTATNAVMGTPGYMAPEQREGKECDARTDIYALGLVVREMATDLPPHLAHVVEWCLANDPPAMCEGTGVGRIQIAPPGRRAANSVSSNSCVGNTAVGFGSPQMLLPNFFSQHSLMRLGGPRWIRTR
jgi:serine/threonine protein kinase